MMYVCETCIRYTDSEPIEAAAALTQVPPFAAEMHAQLAFVLFRTFDSTLTCTGNTSHTFHSHTSRTTVRAPRQKSLLAALRLLSASQ